MGDERRLTLAPSSAPATPPACLINKPRRHSERWVRPKYPYPGKTRRLCLPAHLPSSSPSSVSCCCRCCCLCCFSIRSCIWHQHRTDHEYRDTAGHLITHSLNGRSTDLCHLRQRRSLPTAARAHHLRHHHRQAGSSMSTSALHVSPRQYDREHPPRFGWQARWRWTGRPPVPSPEAPPAMTGSHT